MFGPTKTSNSSPANGVSGPEVKPEIGPTTLNIKVSHGLNHHDIAVPSNSSFGDLKSVIAQKIGVNPETHKLLFRGKEKEDDDDLLTAGVKDDSKVLLMEDITSKQEIPEEVKETSVISRGESAVAEVRKEVDKLSEQVSALQAVVDGGTKVDSKDIIYVTEMLMRQLLKLDGIDAEGEGKVQRKLEVRRVQNFVDIMDALKSKNSNPFTVVDNTVAVTTQWETFEPGSTVPHSTPSPAPSSTTSPMPSSKLSPMPPSNPSPMPSPVRSPLPSSPSPLPSSTKVTEDWERFD